MNTTATCSRPFSTTATGQRASESMKHDVPPEYSPLDDKPVRTKSPPAVRFAHDVARFQRTVGRHRDAARSAIVKELLKTDDPYEFILAVVRTLVSSARPGRLDDAVDILSECGRLLPQFACDLFLRLQTQEIDETCWYVLIRAIGMSGQSSAPMLVEMYWSKSPEAAVEALGDIGGVKSLERLREVADGDSSDFVCQLAAEIVAEGSE